MRMRNVILTLVLALSLGLTACEFGQVEQGRCVAFNPETKTLLVVLDVNHDRDQGSGSPERAVLRC